MPTYRGATGARIKSGQDEVGLDRESMSMPAGFRDNPGNKR
jgi:hypothetical protein